MPRNIFLSFLGAGNYEPMSYYSEAKRQKLLPRPVKYVQQALLTGSYTDPYDLYDWL